MGYPIQFFFSRTLWPCQTSWHPKRNWREGGESTNWRGVVKFREEEEQICHRGRRRRRRALNDQGVNTSTPLSPTGCQKTILLHIWLHIYFFASLLHSVSPFFSPAVLRPYLGKKMNGRRGFRGSTTIPLFSLYSHELTAKIKYTFSPCIFGAI